MFSLIPSDANDPQGLMRRKEPNKQTNKAINKFQRSRMTFDLILETHQYIKAVFSETTWPVDLKLHMENPKLRGVNLYQMLLVT